MSQRTSEANRAIRLAWQNEKKLVLEGKGTRDWTSEQQSDIIERGKAYSDDGRAFEGHHMKSAEMYPEFQGNPGNIQFLSKSEHIEAHNGVFQNPTNGYFNPETGETRVFSAGNYQACDIRDLSNPIVDIHNSSELTSKQEEISSNSSDRKKSITTRDGAKEVVYHTPKFKPVSGIGIIKEVKCVAGNAAGFFLRNKAAINTVLGIAAPIVGEIIIKKVTGGGQSGGSIVDGSDSISKGTGIDIIKRASPSKHMVSAHKQRYNGVWKDKVPYPRGGK